MSKLLHLGPIDVRQDEHGRFNLNDLHRASGGLKKDQPQYFLATPSTIGLVAALSAETPQIPAGRYLAPVEARRGRSGGTFVVRELVIAYAMWINSAFYLQVIRVFDSAQHDRLRLGAVRNERDKLLACSKAKGSAGASLMRRHQIETRAINRQFANLDALVQMTLFPESDFIERVA